PALAIRDDIGAEELRRRARRSRQRPADRDCQRAGRDGSGKCRALAGMDRQTLRPWRRGRGCAPGLWARFTQLSTMRLTREELLMKVARRSAPRRSLPTHTLHFLRAST